MQIYDSYIEAGQKLNKKDRQAFYCALIEYLEYGAEPSLTGAADAVFTAIKPSLRISRVRSESGSKGGSATQENAKQTDKQTPSKLSSKTEANGEANAEANGQGNSKGNSNVEKDVPNGTSQKSDPIPYDEIVGYLNERTGSAFKPDSKETRRHIKARWNDGYRLSDFKRVIDIKVSKWGPDPKMVDFLRPQTLFSTKFESYLNEKPPSQGGGTHVSFDDEYSRL